MGTTSTSGQACAPECFALVCHVMAVGSCGLLAGCAPISNQAGFVCTAQSTLTFSARPRFWTRPEQACAPESFALVCHAMAVGSCGLQAGRNPLNGFVHSGQNAVEQCSPSRWAQPQSWKPPGQTCAPESCPLVCHAMAVGSCGLQAGRMETGLGLAAALHSLAWGVLAPASSLAKAALSCLPCRKQSM